MKTLVLLLIAFYQQFISLPLRLLVGVSSACRYPQSCSEYAVEVITREGVIKGGIKAFVRVLSCQPLIAIKHV